MNTTNRNNITSACINNQTRSHFALLLPVSFLLLGWQGPLAAATLTTDQLDYAPFTYVYVTGTGFASNEVVQLTLETQNADGTWSMAPSDPPDWPNPWTVTAETNGIVNDDWYVWTEDFVGVTFQLTATGQTSGLSAQARFTDANSIDLSLTKSGSPSTVQAGANITYTIVVNNPSANDTTGTVTDTLPAGTTFVSETHVAPSGQIGFTVVTPAVGSSGTVTWTGAGNKSFTKNSTVTFTLVVKVDCSVAHGSTINNTATVAIVAADTDPNTANNSQTATTTVNNPPPALSGCPATPLSFQCISQVPAAATVTATDACDGPRPVSFSETQSKPGSSCNNVITRTWTATDSAGGTASCTQTITVNDTTAPVIGTLPGPSTIQCPATPSFATPTVSDACDPTPTLTFADATTPGTCAQKYSVTRTWTATDACGNSSTKAQQITVIDTTAPVIGSLPAPSTIQCPASPSFTTPTVTDACDPTPTLTFADATTAESCAQNYSVTRTWTATDHCGNSSTKAQQITVVDTTAPVIGSLPAPSTIQCPAAPSFTTPTVSDACDPTPTLTLADATTAGSCAQNYSVTRTWTATDHCGNSSTKAQQITVIDTTVPVIGSLPAPSTIQCPAAPSFTTPTVTDACDPTPTLTFADATTPGSCPQNSTVTRTWTATDHCGNSSTKAQEITVIDTTAPVIGSLPAPATIQCPDTPSFTTPTVTDACDPTPTLSFADATTAGSCAQNYSVTRTWTTTDHCGNSSTTSQQITVIDTTAPVIGSLPAPSTIQCPATPSFTTPTVTDACDPSPTLTFADATTAGSCPQDSTVTRTWTATDHCGNSSTRAQQITVIDTTAPVIGSLPAPATIQCPDTPSFTTPTVTDACDPTPTLSFADATTAGSCAQNYSVTRTWTATDHCGNSSTRSQQITVIDTTAPVIGSLPAPSTIQCPDTPSFTTPTVTDACDPSPTLTFADATTAGSCAQNYSVTRTWTATDHCGNSSTRSQQITVIDTTAPVIGSLPPPSTIQCPDTPSFTTPTVTDACDPTPTLSFADATTAGSCAQNYSVTRTWTATDHCGNSSTRSQQITVIDTTAPVIGSLPAPATIQCPDTPSFTTPTVTDACDPSPTLTFADATTAGSCPQDSTVTRTWTATDHCGNSSTRAQQITVIDTTAPVIGSLPAPATIQCPDTPSFTTPTVTDACDPTPTLSFADATTAGSCAQNYSVTRTWTATDHCGNSSTRSQQITVIDTTAPVIGSLPAPSTIQCPATPSFTTPTVTDACDPTPTLSFADATTAGSCAQNYSVTRTWTATDHCGNSSTRSQQITVIDTTAPVIGSLPPPSTIQCPDTPSFTTPTVTDACDPTPTLSFADATTAGSCAQNYSVTRTWTATDHCGNSSTRSQQITVIDTTAPVIGSLPAPATIQCPDTPSFTTPTVTDACDPSPTLTFADATTAGSCPQDSTVTRTWTATDHCGNSSTRAQQITVIDTTAPVIGSLPAPATIQCPDTPSFTTPTVTDACDPTPTLSFADATTAGSCAQNYSVTRTWTATDHCGNSSTRSQQITVIDTTAPVIGSLPAPSTIQCPATPSFTTPTVTDACDPTPTLSFADATTAGSCAQNYSVTRTWTATDHCGNSSTRSQQITVIDTTAPVIGSLPAPSTIQCPDTPSFTTPTVTDACDPSPTLTFADATTPGVCPQGYSVTRTWTARDCTGNSSTKSQTITVEDTTAPLISAVPGPTTIQCPDTPSFTTPTVTDACDPSPTLTFADATTPGACPQGYSVTRTWTARDCTGNSSTKSQTITVEDTTAPLISAVPGPTTIQCPATPVFATPTATDACDPSPTLTFADATTPGTCPQGYSVTRTWTARDCTGNSSTKSQTITVEDTTAPLISAVPGPTTIQCPATPVFATPTASDACDPSPTLTFADATTPGVCPQGYSVTRTWTARDCTGNSSTKAQQITVIDTTAPVIGVLPAPSTIQCPASPSFTTPTVTDACDATPTLTFADATTAGSCPQDSTVTRTWTATDACGNSSTKAQQITVVDTTAPVIGTLPAPSTIQCPATPSFTTPTVTDACDATPTLTFADATTPGGCPQGSTVTRTWTATDHCGNSSTKAQQITVVDTTAPVIGALPAASTIQCPATPSFATPTVTDACDPTPTLSFADATTPGSCPQDSTVTRTWTATDHCGNSSTRSQQITVIDTTAPVIGSLPAPSTIQCSDPLVFATPTVTDACDPSPTLTFADATTPGTCPEKYRVLRTWTATDHCGNSSTRSQQITVIDTTAPVIGSLPAPSTIQCSDPLVFATPTVTDACDPSPTLTFADATTPGTCPQKYRVLRSWTATDACGNSTTKGQQITVIDTTAPVIGSLPAPSTIQCPDPLVFATPTVTDACDPSPTLTFADATTLGTCPEKYRVLRTWTATDACGNSTTKGQQIMVIDTTAPVIGSLPAPSTIQCPDPLVFATPTVTDACDPSPTLTFADATTPGTCPQKYRVLRTWTATDACGNSTTKGQQITVIDTTVPVIGSLPAPSTIQCPDPLVFATPTVTDACDPSPTLTFADATTPGTCPQKYRVLRSWTATDACGNSSTKGQQITVIDTTVPVIGSLPAPSTIQCSDPLVFATPTVTDACDPSPTLTFADVTTPGTCPEKYRVLRTWSATDACGNSTTKGQQITVIDTTVPVIGSLPAPSTIQCSDPLVFATPTVTDACDPSPTLTFADVTTPGTCPEKYRVLRTWSATDACGNSTTKGQQITVIDTTAPVIGSLPAPSTIQCPDPLVFATPTVTDACDPSPTLTFADVTTPGTCPQKYRVLRSWTATDACGNSSTKGQQITVIDTTVPVIGSLPAPSTIQCPDPLVFATPTVTDACDPSPTLTFADATTPGTCPQKYRVLRSWTATDACGNSSTKGQQITVIDTTAPVIGSLPAPSTIQCPATPSFTTPTVTDACDPNPTLTSADVTTAGSCPQNRMVTRTWTATDHCGNSSTKAQQITVVDTTAPVIGALPAPSTIQCPASPSFTTPTVTDACDPTPTLTFADATTAGSCPQNSTVTRTWTATDHCGNSSTKAQQITVIDTTAPVIGSLPAPSTIQCPASPSFTTPTVTDACDPTPTLTFADATTAGSCPQNSTVTRTWTATDHCGNSSTKAQQITVVDTTAPVIGALPAPSTIQCPASPVFATPTVTDACDSSPTLTFADTSTPGTCAQNKIWTRTWTATDHCGNSSTKCQQITVVDTTAPVIGSLPAPSTIQCPASPVFATPTVTDACDSNPTLTFADTSTPGTCAQNKVWTRTWTATDHCGNSSTKCQQITVVDTTAPVIGSLPAPSTIQCPASPVFATPTVTDACDSNPTLTFADTSTPGTCAQNKVYTRTWTALDHCGNSSTKCQQITVIDTTAPVIGSLPAPCTIQCPATPPFTTPTVSDACDPSPTLTFADTSTQGTCAQNKVWKRTWTATDHCGNSTTKSQEISVVDTTAPVITLPKDYYANCGSGKCSTDPKVTGTPTVTDNCDGAASLTYTDSGTPDANSCQWTITRTWKATDACGNTSTKSQQITCAPYGQAIVTDSSLCSFDWDPSTPCRDFRLLFTPYGSGYKLTASNPGQTFYNVFYVYPGPMPVPTQPRPTVTFLITLPYPYVTQGANPVHAYDGVNFSPGPNLPFCLTPGVPVPITSVTPLPVTLASYSPQAVGTFTTLTVTMDVPDSGFIYLNLHLDFGLKQTYGYSKGGAGNDAVSQATLLVAVPDGTRFLFGMGGDVNYTDGICNMNVFKKNPGVGGRCGKRYVLDGVSDIIAEANAAVTLKDANGTLLTTGNSDADGWYMLSYKWTGKAATLYVTLTPVGKPAQTQSITLKANGFVELNFDVP